MDIKARFFKKIKINILTNCWEWTAAKSCFGYGRFLIKRVNKYAHRVSWELFKGPIPKELCVLHKCDNPKCVNVDHLFLGTKLDNVRDCIQKGRKRNPDQRGEKSRMSPLKNKDIFEIRRLWETKKYSQMKLSKMFGITQTCIGKIVRRETWNHI